MVGILFGSLFAFPTNAYAECVNYVQSQTIAAAYEGDATPTVHTMDTCGGDDVSYQIPIATTITFDGVQYSNVYATTNSVITFGQPDGTFWDYPSTPSISLYSMDWVSGWYNAPDTLNIYYSEGGFQLDLELIPFGQWNTPEPTNINIIVAITNTGGISVAYSYQGPEYPNLRTGVRLHSGEVVSLEAWGATQIQAGDPVPTLAPEPVPDPTASPEPTQEPMTPEEVQAEVVEAVNLANDIANLNSLIAAINGEEVNEPETEPTTEPTEEPEPEPTEEPNLPDPDVEVEPEIITPEDPRFPDDNEQTEPEDSNLPEDSDTTNEESEDADPTPEPSEEPSSQPEETNPDQESESEQPVDEEVVGPPSDNDNTDDINENGISEEELNKLNKLISVNDSRLMAAVSNLLIELSPENKKSLASDLGVKTEEIVLIAEMAKDNPSVAAAVVQFADMAANNEDASMPYTLADAVTELQTEAFLSDPLGFLTEIDFDQVFSPSEWGKDMTDDQREKAQEVIIPVILVSNIVSSVMSLRRL